VLGKDERLRKVPYLLVSETLALRPPDETAPDSGGKSSDVSATPKSSEVATAAYMVCGLARAKKSGRRIRIRKIGNTK